MLHLRVTGSELKRYKEELIEVNDLLRNCQCNRLLQRRMKERHGKIFFTNTRLVWTLTTQYICQIDRIRSKGVWCTSEGDIKPFEPVYRNIIQYISTPVLIWCNSASSCQTSPTTKVFGMRWLGRKNRHFLPLVRTLLSLLLLAGNRLISQHSKINKDNLQHVMTTKITEYIWNTEAC